MPLDEILAYSAVCETDLLVGLAVSGMQNIRVVNEDDYAWKPQVFSWRRTLKQNMKKSLSDRVSC